MATNVGYPVQLVSPEGDKIVPIVSTEGLYDENGQKVDLSSLTPDLDGLPVSDIRKLTIRDGESINAGDVVNVDDGVYHDVVAQDNVENLLYSTALSDISLCYLNDDFSIAALKSSANSITDVYIVNNKTGLGEGRSRLSSDYHQYVKVAKLSDTKFISLYVGSRVYSKIGTVSGTSISFGSQYTVASSASNNADVIALSDILALSIYNSSGLKCKVLPISGTTITTSGTVYSLSSNTGANYISACRLPDEGGNKRVCICFSDTGDSNKGKAVIATIDSSNAVTFGTVKTIENSAVTATACATDGNSIVFNTSDSLILTDLSLNTLDTETSTAGDVTNVSAYTYAFLGTNNNAMVIKTNGGTISKGEAYAINSGSNTNCPSLAATSENGVIAAYSDAGNSNYGKTTILEVSGNQIAGSFIDNSKDAIALADGTGGQSIPVGFGGYCQCDGVTEGQQITSDGVSAFSPLDGWLMISYAQEKQYVVGEYTGDGTTTRTINIGFTPSYVIVGGFNSRATISIKYMENSLVRGFGNSNEVNTSYGITDTGFKVGTSDYGSSSGQTETNTNISGELYSYIAWR